MQTISYQVPQQEVRSMDKGLLLHRDRKYFISKLKIFVANYTLQLSLPAKTCSRLLATAWSIPWPMGGSS